MGMFSARRLGRPAEALIAVEDLQPDDVKRTFYSMQQTIYYYTICVTIPY